MDAFRRFPISRSAVRLLGSPFDNRSVTEYRDAVEQNAALGAEVTRTPKRLADDQTIMVRLAALAPADSDGSSREEAVT
jgi:hypothetical protein